MTENRKSVNDTQYHQNSKNSRTLINGQLRLQERGILETALRYGWHNFDHRQQWEFPSPDPIHGVTGRRYKKYDSNAKPKTGWLPKKPPPQTYYIPQGLDLLTEGVKKFSDVLIWVNGEAALLTIIAAGQYNAMCFVDGENRGIPENFVQHLKSLGVRRIVKPADRDKAGRESAAKMRNALLGSGIEFIALELPDYLPVKADVNDLWIACGFNASLFWEVLNNEDECPDLELPAPEPIKAVFRKTQKQSGDKDAAYWEAEHALYREQEVHPRIPAPDKREGRHDRWFCFNPAHKESHPSARISYERHPDGWVVCTCGDYSLEQAGEWLGARPFMQWWNEERKPLLKPQKRSQRAAQKKETTKQSIKDRIKAVQLPIFPADMRVELRYISNLEINAFFEHMTLLIRSAIGTGKTELIKKLIAEFAARFGYEPKVLVITHRESLARDQAQRLGMECYKDYTGAELHSIGAYLDSIPQLVICYNSLQRLNRQGTPLPIYDLVVIDEIDQANPHLDSETFNGGEPHLAYKISRQLLKTARMFVGLDAHASAATKTYLTGLRGECFALENTYHVQRGTLTLHSDDSTAIGQALQLANEGSIMIVTDKSKEYAKSLVHIFSKKFGPENVRLVCSDTSESRDTQDFIENINEAFPRVLICTTSLGTGVDITIPIRATIGIFAHNLIATERLQAIGRTRNTQETHVYIQPKRYEKIITDAAVLFQRAERAAKKTAIACDFDAHGILAVNDDHRAILKLLSMYKAQRNLQQRDTLSYFAAAAQAEGYPLAYQDGKDAEIRAMLKNALQVVKQAKKSGETSPDTKSVSHSELDEHRAKGTITDVVRLGHEKFIKEDTIGDTLTEENYDDLDTKEKREQVRRHTDLVTPIEELKERDRREASKDYILTKRKHHFVNRQIVEEAIQAVYGETGLDSTEAFTKEEIATRLAPFIQKRGDDLTDYLGWRPDQSKAPVALLRWIIGRAGVAITNRQIMRDGQRFRVYGIDHKKEARMRDYDKTRLAHLAKKQAEKDAEKANYSKPVYVESYVRSEKPKPAAPTLSLDAFDCAFEQRLALAQSDIERQAIVTEYIQQRPALETEWRTKGYAIPRASRMARQYAQAGV